MNFYSNGKLLLTAEYLVMNGAKSLALPTKYGQSLKVTTLTEEQTTIYWKSLDLNQNCWLECEIDFKKFELISITIGEIAIANKLVHILKEAKKSNDSFLANNHSIKVETNLDFERSWGLGTSSTLINNIAQWAKIDAFKLQFTCFGGSGYDIACASNNVPIIYSLTENKKPVIEKVTFNPIFKKQLFFVHLNKKQNSRDAIDNYKKQNFDLKNAILKVNAITQKMMDCDSLGEFNELIIAHELLLSSILNEQPVKEKYFNDYFGEIKSLGAWGGDFVLATGNDKTINYFKSKGFHTILPFEKMIK